MIPQELKNSILRLAIQGKLVEQRAEDGTAEELFQQIQKEKKELIKAKKIKKGKALPDITEDEVPFEIPESWKWVRIGQIFSLQAGKNIKSEAINEERSSCNPYPCYGGNGIRGYVAGFNRKGNYAIMGRQGALCGNINFAFGEFYATEHAVVIEQFAETDVVWCGQFLKALNLNQYSTATAQPGLSVAKINSVLFPLPPLAEQQRIVAKIEQLLPYIDQYEKAWSRLENFNKRFPIDMQKSILQMAIQGKLVEQRPEEGTGEELYHQIQKEKQALIKAKKIKKGKVLPEITEDEVPFEIPESWKWVRLSSVGYTQTGNTPSKAHPEYFGSFIPFIGPGDILNNAIRYDNQGLSEYGIEFGRIVETGAVLQVCIGGSIGKCAIAKKPVAFNQQINSITPIIANSEYLFCLMSSEYFTSFMKKYAGGTATPIINKGIWDTIVVPLPPLTEQKRIVARLEELLPLCERLKKRTALLDMR